MEAETETETANDESEVGKLLDDVSRSLALLSYITDDNALENPLEQTDRREASAHYLPVGGLDKVRLNDET